MRTIINSVSYVLLLLSVTAGVLWSCRPTLGYRIEFLNRGALWEIAAADGKLSIDNRPQLALERTESAFRLRLQERAARDASERTTRSFDSFRMEPPATWPIAEQQRLIVVARKEAAALKALRATPPVKTSYVAHGAHLFVILLSCASAALGWLALSTFVGRGRPETACRVCGYDVRATPHQCPECGSVEPLLGSIVP
jgi:hypothetical protein